MPDVVDLILQDHRELERLFAVLRDEPERRAMTAPVMSTLLFAHSRAEEAEVYPAARAHGVHEDVEHSQKEHLAADQLAEELAGTDPTSDRFASVLEDLIEAVAHHLEEEEETVLPDLRKALSAAELDEVGQRFLAARTRLLGHQPDDLTREQMVQQARNAELSGYAGLDKAELKDSLDDAADL